VNNERIEELMNKAIDESLTPGERRELDDYIASHPEAKHHFENLKRLDHTLREVPPVDPPADLTARIMDLVRGRAENHYQSTTSTSASTSTRLIVRYAYAFAAGIVITLLGLSLFTGVLDDNNLNHRFLTGTAIRDAEQAMPAVAVKDFSQDGFTGQLKSLRLHDTVSVIVDIMSSETLEMVIKYTDSDLAFHGFAQESPTGQSLSVSTGQVRIVHKGTNSYILTFTDTSDSASDITLQIYAADAVLRESVTTGTASLD
jgi:hypothetical protein